MPGRTEAPSGQHAEARAALQGLVEGQRLRPFLDPQFRHLVFSPRSNAASWHAAASRTGRISFLMDRLTTSRMLGGHEDRRLIKNADDIQVGIIPVLLLLK